MGIQMNFDEVGRKFTDFSDHSSEAVNDAVELNMKRIFTETQTRVPKKTGALAATGRIEPNSTDGTTIQHTIWYGEPGEGEDTIDYAAAVHEILHAKHDPPTGPKYVEGPLVEGIPDIERDTASRLDNAAKKAFK